VVVLSGQGNVTKSQRPLEPNGGLLMRPVRNILLFHICNVKGTVYIIFFFKVPINSNEAIEVHIGVGKRTLRALKEHVVDSGPGGGKKEPNLFH